EWKTTRTLLATSIQSYRAACVTLITACAKPMHCPSKRSDLEELLVIMNSELESLVSDENALCETRMSLVTARNRSARLTPVNTLPPEILANIFALSGTCFVQNDTQGFHNFTGVCRYWREIAMNTSDPWTHIDVGPEIPPRLTKTLLGRAKNSSIHIHLYEKTSSESSLVYVPEMLTPHIHRVSAAFLHSSSSSRTLVAATLSLLLNGGSPNLLKTLIVHQPRVGGISHVSINTLGDQPDNPRAVLGSLRKLHLKNINFEWDITAYRSLVDLQLSYPSSPNSTSICISQLVNMLVANPALSILKLSSLQITNAENWSQPPPIKLHCLQVLSLFYIHPEGLQLLLPLITLSIPSPKVCIGGTEFSRICSELEDFVARSHVAELYCYEDYHGWFSTWRSLFRIPSCVRTLGICRFFMRDELIAAIKSERLATPHPSRVLLLGCMVRLEGLEILLEERNIQILHLEQCTVYDGRWRVLGDIPERLSEVHSGLECIVTDTVSEEWERCSMFDR
ncbi:hypothetical protein FS749_000733, partial [Ceratobasidium sp. UAMH 11750]